MNLDQQLVDYAHAWKNRDDDTAQAILEAVDLEDRQRHARLTAPDALGNAARWYVSVGIKVFPLAVDGKLPLLPSAHKKGDPLYKKCKGECGALGHGLYDATLDLDQIDTWWEKTPQANIGIPTGLTFDVIDVDGPPGYATFPTLELPPEIARAITPHGLHVYVPPAPGRGNKTGIYPGIDYRGLGGYVVAPPSRQPDGFYRWTEAPTFMTAA